EPSLPSPCRRCWKQLVKLTSCRSAVATIGSACRAAKPYRFGLMQLPVAAPSGSSSASTKPENSSFEHVQLTFLFDDQQLLSLLSFEEYAVGRIHRVRLYTPPGRD
ncbi:MAG: hypothetical protein ABSG53_02805, partial [Thermoguttaceae bacterium]